ncbi:hypothetical protein Dform_00497 [Dehalogenimonas formicexedens]|uniref:Uncharacterized protein n=2 Tax=Dehalogenimonas TaxID=670486 RepID=A0A1P8F682_9CHLR|nr:MULTISPECIES: hypothetical protein [Dehalogenimonas]APV43852.1 hypothetical protein Dform_00497 [Dehalogenimonas formicexedens]KTB49321.1 hypothetical protein DEALK_02340 [Dehalogenimonas alkenigignens]
MDNNDEAKLSCGEFVSEWGDRWFQLGDLLFDVLRRDKSPSENKIPFSASNAATYELLREWLTSHEERFLDLWQWFYKEKLTALEPDSDYLREYWQNPFAMFYRPSALPELLTAFDLQTSVDDWTPDENKCWEVAMVVLQLAPIVASFYKWADEEIAALLRSELT